MGHSDLSGSRCAWQPKLICILRTKVLKKTETTFTQRGSVPNRIISVLFYSQCQGHFSFIVVVVFPQGTFKMEQGTSFLLQQSIFSAFN